MAKVLYKGFGNCIVSILQLFRDNFTFNFTSVEFPLFLVIFDETKNLFRQLNCTYFDVSKFIQV